MNVYSLWYEYLGQTYPLHMIDEVVVYTDEFRYWFADGILEVADKQGWKASVTLLDELTDELINELRQSFITLSESTLLAGIFSQYNPTIDEINQIFEPLTPPVGYQGYSFLSQNNFPDQYLAEFLNINLYKTEEYQSKLEHILENQNIIKLNSANGTELEFEITPTRVAYPYNAITNKHVLFPATELIVEIVPDSVNGTIVIDRSIGAFEENGELIDPMGRVMQPIEVNVDNGYCEVISPASSLSNRLENYLEQLASPYITSIGFGLGRTLPASGFLQVDRLGRETSTFSIDDAQLEFNIDGISVE